MGKTKKEITKKGISIYNFIGKMWTERFFQCGMVKKVILRVGEEEALLEYPPFSWFEYQKDRKLHDEYVKEKAKEGWNWCASWGYYFFKRKCSKIEDKKVEVEILKK